MRACNYVLPGVLVAVASAAAVANAQEPRDQATTMASAALNEAATGAPLPLEEALESALRQNPGIRVLQLQVEPVRARQAQALTLPPPMLEAQIWQWPINTLNPTKTDMYMLTLSQELSGGGKRQAAAAVAGAEVRAREAAVPVLALEITEAVTSAYWQLAAARIAIRRHLEAVDLLEQLSDLAQAKYAAGQVPQQDVLKSAVEITALHEDLIMLERDAKRGTQQLNSLLNRPLDTPIGELSAAPETTLAASLDELQALALREQPMLRAADADLSRAKAELELSRTRQKPDWSIGGGYMQRPGMTDAWAARVSMTWPNAPWSRRSVDTALAETTAAVSASEAAIAAVTREAALAVADGYAKVRAVEARAALLRTALTPQARQLFDVSLAGYQSGRGDIVSVVEGERTWLDSEIKYDRTLIEWKQALAELERALGTRLPSSMLRIREGVQ